MQNELLSPEAVDATLALLRARVEAPSPAADEEHARRVLALARVDTEVSRLTRAIASTDDAPGALVAALRDAEGRQRALREGVGRRPERAGAFDWDAFESATRRELADLRGLFGRQVTNARAVLSALLRGPIVCRPVEIEGPGGAATTFRRRRRSRVSI